MKGEAEKKLLERMRLVEQRYEAENRLMELVRSGRGEKARQILGTIPRTQLEKRSDATRDARNYTIILNTLMRKAAEQSGVAPFYIDRLSTDYALRIEKTVAWDAFLSLWQEMAKGYCDLVRQVSDRAHSSLVRKAIQRIDFDLTADLSLHATARFLNVNPSYLSTLFKRETKQSFTEYVTAKRMDHAAYLLRSTQMRVSAVAQSCGISDDNYFTKLFKGATGLTPIQYRKTMQTKES